MLTQTLLALATAATTSAHFVLNWPPTAGFLDEEEVNGPCGGATVVVNETSPEVQVNRFAAQIQSSHPTGNWQFRATLDTQEPYNWTNLSMVQTEGPGIFCLNYLSVPEEFAGNGGILQVTDFSGDGTLYQVCVNLSFVSCEQLLIHVNSARLSTSPQAPTRPLATHAPTPPASRLSGPTPQKAQMMATLTTPATPTQALALPHLARPVRLHPAVHRRLQAPSRPRVWVRLLEAWELSRLA